MRNVYTASIVFLSFCALIVQVSCSSEADALLGEWEMVTFTENGRTVDADSDDWTLMLSLGLNSRFVLKEIEHGKTQHIYRGSFSVKDGVLELNTEEEDNNRPTNFAFDYEYKKRGELEELTLVVKEPNNISGRVWTFGRAK